MSRQACAADVDPIQIELVGTSTCGSSDDFWADLHARTRRARRAEAGEIPRLTLRIRLEKRADDFAGDLTLIAAGGVSSHRHLTGDTCATVLSSLALVAALAIDPEAKLSLAPTAQPLAREESPPPPPPPSPSPPAFPAPPAVSPSAAPVAANAPDVPSHVPHARWRATIGAGVGGLGLSAPGPVPDGAVFAGLALDSPSVLSPSFRIAIGRTLQTTIGVSGGSGAFAWTFGRAEGCPLRIGIVTTLVVRPCVLIDAGALSATGQGAAQTGSPVRPWVAAGGLARLEWDAYNLGRWAIVVDADGGAELPITRESFYFHPSTNVYQPPVVAGIADLGAGVRFP